MLSETSKMVAESIGGFIGAVVILTIAYLIKHFVIVPQNHVLVCRTWSGGFSRILKEGLHIMNPLEYKSEHRWVYQSQEYNQRELRGTFLCVIGDQIDIAPTECTTSDNVTLSVDTMIVFNVSDPQKATFVTNDPLNLLCQQVSKYIRNEVQKYERAKIQRFESDIAATVCASIKDDWTPTYGLELKSCEIQSISDDEDTIRRRRQMRDGFSAKDCAEIERLKNSKLLLAH